MTSKGVNKPTDPKVRDQDIDRKLQLYGIVEAFRNGKVPSNQQIDVAMNSALAWKPLANPPSSLSQEGRLLCEDLRQVIQQAKVLVLSKNSGNLFQDFTWQTRHIGQGDASGVKAPVDKDTAQQHGNEALEDLRILGELLITNGQFRKLLSDSTILLRDVAGDAAQKTANRVNPSEDQLNQIDQPEADNVFHDKPDFSRENLKQQAQQARSNVPLGREDVKKAAGDATQTAHPSGTRDPAEAASRDRQYGDTTGADPRQGAKEGLSTVQARAEQNMTEEQKQQFRERKERARNYLDEKMPKERRDQVIWRLKKMVVECQDHSDYQRAIESLLRLAEEYQGHTKNVTSSAAGDVKGARNQGPQQAAEYDLKTLLERFANGTSADGMIDAVNQIYRDADQDPELRNYFKSLDAYIRKCLKQVGFILEDRANEEYNQLHRQGEYLLREKYKDHTDRITDEIKFFGEQFDKDAQNKAFANSIEKLFKDLGQDASGQPKFKPHLLEDLGNVIIPGFFQRVGYIPIPRIEYSDPMIDAVVENLVLEGDNLFPNEAELGSDNYWRWGRAMSKGTNRNKNSAMFSVSGIQADIKDVAYYVKKKEGFPGITDKGVLDIFFGGSGISFKVDMETADPSDQAHFFKIKKVVIDIQNMDIKVKQSNHKLLFSLFKPILIKVVRPVVQKVLEKQIRDNVHKLDGMCYEAKKEADRAAEEARRNPDPDNVKNIYQRYYEAFQRQLSKGQQKKEDAKAAAADKQANVAITQHDSIFKNISLPGGFSTQATKYKDMAHQGEKWQSPIFGIGSAPESKGIEATQVGKTSPFGNRGPVSSDRGGVSQGLQQSTLPDRTAGAGVQPSWTDMHNTSGPHGGDLQRDFRHDDGHTTLGRHNPLLDRP